MTKRVVELCEVCGETVDGLAIIWRRGFMAVCCVSCACALARLLRENRVRFSAKNAKTVATILIRKRQSAGVNGATTDSEMKRLSFAAREAMATV